MQDKDSYGGDINLDDVILKNNDKPNYSSVALFLMATLWQFLSQTQKLEPPCTA